MTTGNAARLVRLIESAYALDLGSREWLQAMVVDLAAVFESGPSIAIEYEKGKTFALSFPDWSTTDVGPFEQSIVDWLLGHEETLSALAILGGPVHRLPPTLRASDLVGRSLLESPLLPIAAHFGVRDVVMVNASDGTERGVLFALPSGSKDTLLSRAARVTPHIAAALRIRHGLADLRGTLGLDELAQQAEAVLNVDGIVREGDVAATDREILRHAVIERDRLRLRQSDPDDTLEAWTALVEGRWSLVDSFERNGKRWVVAIPNLPAVRDPRALSPIQRAVFALLGLGRSNKRIGFELGISEGTVSGYITDIRRRLGNETLRAASSGPAALVRRFLLDPTELVVIAIESLASRRSLDALTDSEQRVVELVLSGLSNQEIAKRRNRSARTIANQLASAFQKLGVGSRRELRTTIGDATLVERDATPRK